MPSFDGVLKAALGARLVQRLDGLLPTMYAAFQLKAATRNLGLQLPYANAYLGFAFEGRVPWPGRKSQVTTDGARLNDLLTLARTCRGNCKPPEIFL
jgi:hypothetical protein